MPHPLTEKERQALYDRIPDGAWYTLEEATSYEDDVLQRVVEVPQEE